MKLTNQDLPINLYEKEFIPPPPTPPIKEVLKGKLKVKLI